ncbi:unnamed protein product, partial [Porites lobata]
CLRYCAFLCVSFSVLFRKNDMASALTQVKPSREDFALSELSPEDKEKFLDEHNKFRGMVQPPAADMEYLFWDDDLANLAQMWANQCIWDHGFVAFGDEYPYEVPFKGRVGQNLAREWGELSSPEDRVEPWYKEHEYYTYSKFASPMGAACSKEPCGHYTQLAWARSKFVGCGVKWCDKEFGMSHPWIPGETIVSCDYGPSGNIIGQFPYKQGTPCSKCASGKGFCYKNLCRDCDNFDSECGKSLSKDMCSSHRELMAKKCPKMCDLCECPLKCQNGGTVNRQSCICVCPSGWKGMDCSVRCYDAAGKDTCEWRVRNGHSCKEYYMKIDCAATCGYCVIESKTTTTTPAPITTTVPTITIPPTTVAVTTAGIPSFPEPTVPEDCKKDLHSDCGLWAGVGECEKNPPWMIPNCCVSCKYHQAPKDCIDSQSSCPRWAFHGECEKNKAWMLANCRKSCNQCGDCKDTNVVDCPSWALQNQCISGNRVTWMHINCRRSCGMCKVYDKHEDCPALAARDECTKSNRTWIVDRCPRSCELKFSEACFCGNKTNGNYQDPTTCEAYIACSNGVTSHVQCPKGKKFDTVKRICELADTVSNCNTMVKCT